MLKKKEIAEARTRELIDWLCYACWREYDPAYRRGEKAKARKEKEIAWMKSELEKRTSNWKQTEKE